MKKEDLIKLIETLEIEEIKSLKIVYYKDELIDEILKDEDEIERLKSIINEAIEFIYNNAYNEDRTYQVNDLWYKIPKLLDILKGEDND